MGEKEERKDGGCPSCLSGLPCNISITHVFPLIMILDHPSRSLKDSGGVCGNDPVISWTTSVSNGIIDWRSGKIACARLLAVITGKPLFCTKLRTSLRFGRTVLDRSASWNRFSVLYFSGFSDLIRSNSNFTARRGRSFCLLLCSNPAS